MSATARAQDGDASLSSSSPHGQWFLGVYYRHNWVPSYVLNMFLSRAPSITNDGFGLTVSHRSAGGFTAQVGVGYMPYTAIGAFTADNTLIEDTEWIKSDLALIHVTGSLLWPIEITQQVGFEFGFGLDVGAFVDDVIRTEAVLHNGRFEPCNSALNPADTGPDRDSAGKPIHYCGEALDRNGNVLASGTNKASEDGEQYHVRETRIPPLIAFPMLPHLALRIAPWERVAFKLEFSFGIAQIWAGASIHVGFGGNYKPRVEDEVEVDEPRVAAVPAARKPRVYAKLLGKVLINGTHKPVPHAELRSARVLSQFESNDNGDFVVDKIEPGPVRFDITHPDYNKAVCQTTIPEEGGEITLDCFLVPLPSEGAISGQVKDEKGNPVARARITIMGPSVNGEVLSSPDGLFALPDAAPGNYRIRVDAEGYLMQLVTVDVSPRDTAMPEINLIAKPKTSLVTLKASEIKISQQINFASNSAEIGESSDGLMREIADVLLRHDEITVLEIQGHTDNKGGEEHNMELSQARADAVRDWLVRAGVAPTRMRARGYGQTMPLFPNNNPGNRAANRRVQFIIVH